jgi:hypothetical protein
VPQYANRLQSAGYTVSDLNAFQKYLIATSNVLKNIGLLILPLVVLAAAAFGGLIQKLWPDKENGHGAQASPVP